MATPKEFMESLKRDWQPTDYYNFEDLNRVEEGLQIIRDQIALYRGEIVSLETPITNRDVNTIEMADSLNRIERNFLRLKFTFPEWDTRFREGRSWKYNDSFDFVTANRYENDLYDMYYAIESNLSNVVYCGDYIVGQKGVI